jgi:AraC-like DNA-binding protein
VFLQPQAFKDAWNETVHRDWVYPAETLGELSSFLVYLLLSLRRYRAYQGWLDSHLSNREEFRITWLRNVLMAFVVVWPVWASYEVLSYGFGFDYFQRFPLYVCFTGLVFYLGLEGWRHAGIRYPVPSSTVDTDTAVPEEQGTERTGHDWPARGRAWMARIEAEQWWRDPDLSLERLAQRLGTNTAYVSRALNEGLGVSFNEAVNRLRVDEVCRQLREGSTQPLLDLALAAGFNSKTSFNRCFRACTGMTPSRFRAQIDGGGANPRGSDEGAEPGASAKA